MAEVILIEVSVGKLPEWYNEDQHDPCLELAIEEKWHKNPDFSNARIAVSYNYLSEDAIVKFYDDDGNVTFERDNHDLGYAFAYAREAC